MPAVNRHFNSVLVWGRNQVEKLTNVDEDNAIRITKHVTLATYNAGVSTSCSEH